MITESPLLIEPLIETNGSQSESTGWNRELANAIRTVPDLLERLNLSADDLPQRIQAASGFPVLVPEPFLRKMTPGNPSDPLLLQVLPSAEENESASGYVADPLAEKHSNNQKGLIHKYNGRVLMLLSTGCAVNCRYCFRRHFPYQENRLSRQEREQVLSYISAQPDISELILSGGDPLMLSDKHLAEFIEQAENIPHLKRLRIHTRLPVVIPQRLTQSFITILQNTRLDCAIVLHINHSDEIDDALRKALLPLRQAGIALLNQSVLLRGVNNNAEQLISLSENLFSAGILPYYLHLLDKVQGAHHFDVTDTSVQDLYQQLLLNLPGYLVPKLVREESGKGSKTPVPVVLRD